MHVRSLDDVVRCVAGGSKSHEYHIQASIGDDQLLSCPSCNFAANIETIDGGAAATRCPQCGAEGMREHKGIEVGHTFYLGTKYSEAFDCTYKNAHGEDVLTEMGCYGLGVTRILQAAIEVGHDADGIVWPTLQLAPYKVTITVMNGKMNKKAAASGLGETMVEHANTLYDKLHSDPALHGEVILDTSDRKTGEKMADAALVGYPWQIVVGGRFNPDELEVRRRSDDGRSSVTMTYDEFVAAVGESI